MNISIGTVNARQWNICAELCQPQSFIFLKKIVVLNEPFRCWVSNLGDGGDGVVVGVFVYLCAFNAPS